MDCFLERGKLNVEGCALSGGRTYIDFSCMLFDYTVADGQAQACAAAVRFGGEKRIENAMNVFAGNARAGVGHFDLDAAIVGGGADFEHPAAGHGAARVQKQIEKDLLELVGGAAHRRQGIAQLLDDVNLRSLERVRNERKSFFDDAIDVDIGQLGGAGAREIQKVIDNFAGPERLLDDFVDDGVARIFVGHLLSKHLNVVGDDRERRIDFVRHTGSEQAEGRELLRLGHLLFHALALRDVVEEQEAADALAGLADQRSNGNVESKEFALVMEPLLIDAGDLLFIAPRGDFRGKLFRQERAQLAAHGGLPLHAEQLLHARVPGLNHAAEIDGQNPDVQGFDDVFTEILEARDLQRFLLKRRIELGI